jgi:DNA-binding CsgD family transcriptional regulator
MEINLSIHFEILRTYIFFLSFYLLFYKLHYQGSQTRRVLLIVSMVLYRPLSSFIVYNPFFKLPALGEVLISSAMIAGIALLVGGVSKRAVWITAAYFFGAVVFIDSISTAMVLGLSGKLNLPNKELYFWGIMSPYIILFLSSLVYYLAMKDTPREVLDRIPLPVWLVILLIPPAGAAVFYLVADTLFMQLEAGYNYFLFFGLSLLSLPVLSVVFFFLIKGLVTANNARLLAAELKKGPPGNGLTPEFIEKYGLTEREAEIAKSLLEGKSNKEIGDTLYISIPTVKTHLTAIYRKTDTSNRYTLKRLTGGLINNRPVSGFRD